MYFEKENEIVEFKETVSELKEALIDIVAILNKHNKGTLYFGLSDEGKEIKFDIGEDTLRNISKKIREKIKPQIFPIIEVIDNTNIIKVSFEGYEEPYSCDGRYYKRVSDESLELSSGELVYMILSKNYKEYELLKSDSTIDDIDDSLIKETYDMIINKNRIPYFSYNKITFLKKLNLLDKDNIHLNNAGELLFSENNETILNIGIFLSLDKTNIFSIDKKRNNVLSLIKEAENFVIKNLTLLSSINGLYRNDYLEIPEEIIREVILNSFAHANYLSTSYNEIDIYPDRIVFYNPGSFIDDLSPYDYINNSLSSKLRNPILANVLFLMGLIEQWGSGLKRIDELSKKNNIKYEYQKEIDGSYFIFYRNSYLNNNKEIDQFSNLSETDKNVLLEIKKNNKINRKELSLLFNKNERTISRSIDKLKKMKIIERIGSNKTGYWKINN